MRRLLIAIAATALLATPVVAQPYGSGPGPGPGPGPGAGYGAQGPAGPENRGDYDRRDGRDDRGGPDYRRDDDRRDWNNRGGRSWKRHVRACSARYRSYNPRTDRYVVRRGVTARCRL